MHFIDAVGGRPGFFAHGGNRFGVQRAEVVGRFRVAPAAVEHRLRAAFFQRRIVEKGVGAGAENLRRQWRGCRQVAADQPDLAALHAPQQREPAFAVHGFVQAIVEGLFHQRMVGNVPLADEVFHAGDLIGKHTGDQVFALHPLDLRRDFSPAGVAWQRQRHPGIPAPAHAEQRRIEDGLNQRVLGAVAVQVTPHVIQLKTVAGGQRQHDGVFTGGSLQFEVEGAAETLAQGQAPGAVDAAAERRVDDQLRATGLVEKPFHQQCVLRGQGAEGLARAGQVFHQLFGAGQVQAEGLRQPVEAGLQVARRGTQQFIELRLQARDGERQFRAAPRCFAEPERYGRRLTLGILDPDLAGLDPQDPVRRVAQLKNVASDAFHREVFVDAADVQPLWLQQHAVVGVVRNGPAAGHGRQLGAPATAQAAGHRVAVQVSAADALATVVALGEHAQQRLVMFFVEPGVGRSLAEQRQ